MTYPNARVAARAEGLEAEAGQDVVLADQRHDVGDGSEGGQAGGSDEKLAERFVNAVTPAQGLADGPGEFHRHARARQVAERVRGAGQFRVDDRQGGWQPAGVRLVVVRHDDVQAEFAGPGHLRLPADAAVHRHEDAGTLAGQVLDGLAVQAVPFLDAVWHVDADVGIGQAEGLPEDGGRRDAVHVVVAVDDDRLAVAGGCHEPVGGLRQARQRLGRVKVRQVRFQERAGGLHRVVAPLAQDARHQRVDAEARRQTGGAGKGRLDGPLLGHGKANVKCQMINAKSAASGG